MSERTLQKALDRAAELTGYRRYIFKYGHYSDETAYTVLLADEVERLRARLKWFEEREPLVQAIREDGATSRNPAQFDLWNWETRNPKPEPGAST